MATLKSTTVADGTIELPDHSSAPSPTANKLYANTTSLYWEDGDLVSGGGGGAADKQTTGNAISNSSASDTGASQGYRMHPGSSTTLGITAKANTFMHGTFYNELVVMGDVEAPGLYLRGEGTDDAAVGTGDDLSPNGHTLTINGDTKYENTIKLPWATTSIYFDGTADDIGLAAHKDWNLGRGPFTIEGWAYRTSDTTQQVLFGGGGGAATTFFGVRMEGGGFNLMPGWTGAEVAGAKSLWAINTWVHWALVGTETHVTFYVDGKATVSGTRQGIDYDLAAWEIGHSTNIPGGWGNTNYIGYMAEFRLTKGMARYTENFVPPQGYLSSRMASFAIDATTFNSTESPGTLDIGSRDRLGDDTLGDGHCQVTFKENYTINSTAYMIPIEFKNTSDHEWSLNYNIWPKSISNTYMLASDSVPVFAGSAFYGNRGVYVGGQGHAYDVIEYFTISTSSEAVDFGETPYPRAETSGVSNGSRGLYAGYWMPGSTPEPSPSRSPNGYGNIIEYITIATTGNSADFGDLTQYRSVPATMGDGSRGAFAAGSADPGDVLSNVIDYITISTTGNAKDFGDVVTGKRLAMGNSNGSRGLIMGGYIPPSGPTSVSSNIIDYVTIGIAAAAIDYGDLLIPARTSGGVSDGSRGLCIGGTKTPFPGYLSSIDYMNIGAIGNASDFGEIQAGVSSNGTASSNGSRGIHNIGSQGPTNSDGVDYFTIGVLGASVDFNELSSARYAMAAFSGD